MNGCFQRACPGREFDQTPEAGQCAVAAELIDEDTGRILVRGLVRTRVPISIHLFFWIVIVDANGIIREREIMLRAFRPSDDSLLAAIHSARGDALNDEYKNLQKKIRKVIVG